MRGMGLLAAGCLMVLPAFSQEWARARLEKSPRHQEWVQVKHDGRVLQAFVVYPEARGKTGAILVIHENMGLTDWVRGMADQLAEAGYIAIAPDLLSGLAPGGGRTSDFPDVSAAREAIYKLKPESVTGDLDAVADYVRGLPAANGKVAVAGFCWGGSQAFRFAAHRGDLAAAFVFYGTGPEDVGGVRAPVYGFYGGNDARVDATVPGAAELMKKAGKIFQPVTYEGAGHGFMRSGEDPNGTEANRKARQEAWRRWISLLRKHMG